jgi:hypothetical protein
MSGGEISGNTASASAYNDYNAGVYGGGVYNAGTFTMESGTISGNAASAYASASGGGGVYNTGTFTMSGGEISGHTLSGSSDGGGVLVYTGTFTMENGTISGNTAVIGGGVYAQGTFNKQYLGVIYGSDDSALKNTASSDGSGHAVYTGSGYRRDTTAGRGVILDSSISGAAGGWE